MLVRLAACKYGICTLVPCKYAYASIAHNRISVLRLVLFGFLHARQPSSKAVVWNTLSKPLLT